VAAAHLIFVGSCKLSSAAEGDTEGGLDRATVAALYLEHADELRRMLLGVLRDGQLAADALQLAFVRAMECGGDVRDESRKAWLFRVAYNEALAILRRAATHQRATERLGCERRSND
jgi:RNA polymerase sigma-70 factor (ECF subfamily)